MLNNGADKISLNTAAVQNPELIRDGAERFGSQCIVLAIDARRSARAGHWDVYTHGGRKLTALDALEWARRGVELGAGEILLTSMDSDGTHNCFDCDFTARISESVSVPVIASGGAGNLEHLYKCSARKADAVLARVFSTSTYTIPEGRELASQTSGCGCRCAEIPPFGFSGGGERKSVSREEFAQGMKESDWNRDSDGGKPSSKLC